MIGNSPGQKVIAGSMGRPLPGYRIALLDADGLESDQGEIALPLRPRPVGLMRGYQNERASSTPIEGDYYRTGDVASRDAEGYITYIGRADDVFKSSDYRLSPFELESALIEHEAVAEAAVVPAPDPVRYHDRQGLCRAGRRHSRGPRRRRPRSSPTCARASRPTSACAGSSSPSCRRPCRARSAGSSCATARAELAERGERADARVPDRGFSGRVASRRSRCRRPETRSA